MHYRLGGISCCSWTCHCTVAVSSSVLFVRIVAQSSNLTNHKLANVWTCNSIACHWLCDPVSRFLTWWRLQLMCKRQTLPKRVNFLLPAITVQWSLINTCRGSRGCNHVQEHWIVPNRLLGSCKDSSMQLAQKVLISTACPLRHVSSRPSWRHVAHGNSPNSLSFVRSFFFGKGRSCFWWSLHLQIRLACH